MSSSILAVAIGSRAEQGSSIRSTSGSTAIARAMHRRCCCPPESPSAESLSRSCTSSHSAAAVRLRSTMPSRSARLRTPRMRGPYATFSKIDFGKGFDFWKTMPTRLRSSVTSSPGSWMSVAPMRMLPAIRTPSTKSFMRLRHRSRVDLPQPEGPMYAVTRCFGIDMETSFSASFSPYQSETCSISTIGASMIPATLAWAFRFGAIWTLPAMTSSLFLILLDCRHGVLPPEPVTGADGEQVEQDHDQEQEHRGHEHHRARGVDVG